MTKFIITYTWKKDSQIHEETVEADSIHDAKRDFVKSMSDLLNRIISIIPMLSEKK